jgi:hypothetical protein
MTVKVALLKSGESIISDLKEGIIDDKVVTYLLNNPCSIICDSLRELRNDDGAGEKELSVYMEPWPRYSKDTVIPIEVDYVATIIEPKDEIKELYERNVVNGNQTISTDEQSDSGQSD